MVHFSDGSVIPHNVTTGGSSTEDVYYTVTSDHLAIDRITHAAADGAKFDDEALDNPQFAFSMSLEFTDAMPDLECAALFLLLVRDLTRKASGISFGAHTSRGYGAIHPADVKAIEGSFCGTVMESLPASAQAVRQSGKQRSVFSVSDEGGSEPEAIFKTLSKEFDKYWQNARLRRVPA